MNSRVLVYRNELLPFSETFILAQARSLQRFEAQFVGMRQVRGLDVVPPRPIVVNDGGLKGAMSEYMFRYMSRPPAGVIARLLATHPVLVHAHFAFDAHWAAAIARRLRLPMVVTLHGFDVTRRSAAFAGSPNPAYRRFPERRAKVFRVAEHLIAVSEFIRDRAIEAGCPSERISAHYIGIDLLKFPYLRRPASHQNILFVGRMVPNKGCSHLIRAMSVVQRFFPKAQLRIIGDGPLRRELQALAARTLASFCFLGSQSPSAVLAEMHNAAVLCVPSIETPDGDSEGLGMVFLEAQATGLPVVSFETGGVVEAVENGTTGLLVRAGDDAALADAICRVLQDDNLRHSLGLAGRARVEQRFSLTRQTAKLEEIYDSVLAKSAAAGRR